MMCGSTMGVCGGLSFYTSAALLATPLYLASPRFTPEKSRLEEKCKLSKGAKYILNICSVTICEIKSE